METLGDRIKKRMDALGLSQGEVADLAGISQVAIHKLIAGKSLKTDHPLELANALQCSPHWLVTGQDDPNIRHGVKEGAQGYDVETSDEMILLATWRAMNHDQQKSLLTILAPYSPNDPESPGRSATANRALKQKKAPPKTE